MTRVVFGFLGTKLDAGPSENRWERWRPTVAMFGHDNFEVDRLELFVSAPVHQATVESVVADIHSLRPGVDVRVNLLDVEDPWNFQQVYSALHDFSKNYSFAEGEEHFVHLTTGTHVAQICLFLLTEARYFPAQLLETFSHRAKEPWRGSLEVIDLHLSTYDLLAKRFSKEREDSQSLLKGGISTRNVDFNALIGRIEHVALKSAAPLLLTGPTGAGKTELARRVHELRAHRHLVRGSLIEVNCATLRGDSAMSTLFGHKKGAFTGASADRSGLLKSADGGTLFLDEIGTLGLDEQAMLLRALESKRFLAVGADKETASNFQLLAGTNLDLEAQVEAGKFRSDLLARINLWHFTLPGLAQRPEDIEPNLDFELERAAQELGQRITMTTEARKTYLDCALRAPWPGNFRDLASSVSRMATLCDRGRIGVDDVILETSRMSRVGSALARRHALTEKVFSAEKRAAIDSFDLAQLEAVLEALVRSDSLAGAGRELFAVSRAAKSNPNDSDRLRKYLTSWGLDYRDLKLRLA